MSKAGGRKRPPQGEGEAMYAIHVRDRIEKRAGFLGTDDLFHVVTDIRNVRRFATRREAEECLREMDRTPLHPRNAGSATISFTIVPFDR